MQTDGKTATVFFNGPSVRQFLDIPRQSLEIGCNFIEQHRAVDHVCAYDRPVIESLTRRGLTQGVGYWTRTQHQRAPWRTVGAHTTSGTWRHHTGFCSGTLALALAVQLRVERIVLLGLDWQETNASIFDHRYEWRANQPIKHNRHKQDFLQHISEMTQLDVVHDRPRGFGDRIQWIRSDDFLRSI